MALYICCKCGETFDEPFRATDLISGSWDSCPMCGDVDFEPAFQCRGCRKDLSYSKLIGGEYCPECIDDAIRDRPDLVREYMRLDDVRENFADFLAEMRWEPWRRKVKDYE